MLTYTDSVVFLCSFFTVVFWAVTGYVVHGYVVLLKRKHRKEIAEKDKIIKDLQTAYNALNLLYQSAPIIKGKDQTLPLFGKLPKGNGTVVESVIGKKHLQALQTELIAHNNGKVKVCRTYWEWSQHRGWRPVKDETLMLTPQDVATEFYSVDSTHCYKDEEINVWQEVKVK